MHFATLQRRRVDASFFISSLFSLPSSLKLTFVRVFLERVRRVRTHLLARTLGRHGEGAGRGARQVLFSLFPPRDGEELPLCSWRASFVRRQSHLVATFFFLPLRKRLRALLFHTCLSFSPATRERARRSTVDDPCRSRRGVSDRQKSAAEARDDDVALGIDEAGASTASSLDFFSPGSQPPGTDLLCEPGRLETSVDAPTVAQPGERGSVTMFPLPHLIVFFFFFFFFSSSSSDRTSSFPPSCF